ncbi:MAG: L7Ae/L30e/S12e/Gadd45 family ribosomal protein [Lachnospiraceae bacterium]
MSDRILSFLGLAEKAGKAETGGFAVDKAVKDGRAYLVIVASDASARTRKSLSDLCAYYHVAMRIYADKETLGAAAGKDGRSCVAITDSGFAKALEKKLISAEEKDR